MSLRRLPLLVLLLSVLSCSGDGGRGPTEPEFPELLDVSTLTGSWSVQGRQLDPIPCETGTLCIAIGEGGREVRQYYRVFRGTVEVGPPVQPASVSERGDLKVGLVDLSVRIVGVDSLWSVGRLFADRFSPRVRSIDHTTTMSVRSESSLSLQTTLARAEFRLPAWVGFETSRVGEGETNATRLAIGSVLESRLYTEEGGWRLTRTR